MNNALAFEVKFTADSMVEACHQLALQVQRRADDYDRFELTTANVEFNPDPKKCIYSVRALLVYPAKAFVPFPKPNYSEVL